MILGSSKKVQLVMGLDNGLKEKKEEKYLRNPKALGFHILKRKEEEKGSHHYSSSLPLGFKTRAVASTRQ